MTTYPPKTWQKRFKRLGLCLAICHGLHASAASSEHAMEPSTCHSNLSVQEEGALKTVQMFGYEVEILSFPRRHHYSIDETLPHLSEALLIFVRQRGHVLLSYKGIRLDSKGKPLITPIRTFSRRSSGLKPGLVFAIRNLPERFEEAYRAQAENRDSGWYATCGQAACHTLVELGVFENHLIPYARTTSLVRELWSLSDQKKSELDLEVIALGVSPLEHYNQILEFEAETLLNVAIVAGAGGFSLMSLLNFLLQ